MFNDWTNETWSTGNVHQDIYNRVMEANGAPQLTCDSLDWVYCDHQGNVVELQLGSEALSGVLNTNLLDAMPKLKILAMAYNKLEGTINDHIFSAPTLEEVDIRKNSFTGSIPCPSVAEPVLYSLYMSNNHFTGSLPSSLGTLSSLTKLSFNLNALTGAVPASLCNLRLMEDCRVGSDTDYAPYGLDSEWQWVIRAKGNVFSCPVPPCVANGVCNASVADPVASPIRCQ